ncbi:MAG: selenide, water dikinase SelD [Gammaproteobacteria bacterium]|nr:selenide, water dikinase SelD [Gammaproteobacteria bacterium]
MISTVDFITPPVDDPYWFGQIGAANAISDIYAMGGRPLTALNIVMFPTKQLDLGLLRDILRGGHDKVVEAGASVAGGHSVDDEEPKFGLCVNGVVHPRQVITNTGAQAGDSLILTKPLGTGVLFNALRDGKLSFLDLERDVLPQVAALNGPAMAAARTFDLHACTDITGFGLAGHILEMIRGSQIKVVLDFSALPLYPGAFDMYKKGVTTGSNTANWQRAQAFLDIRITFDKAAEEILYDPQTSGGLLLALPASQAEAAIRALVAAGVPAAVKVGEVVAGTPGIMLT